MVGTIDMGLPYSTLELGLFVELKLKLLHVFANEILVRMYADSSLFSELLTVTNLFMPLKLLVKAG